MNKFKTPNPGRFKRKPETTEVSGFTVVCGIVCLTCLGLLIGSAVGKMLYPILKSMGVFS